jgi:predicted enzyme related to lactoylglutathione lyase
MHNLRRDAVIKIIFASFLFCTSGLSVPPPPAIQYVGAISINPSHDTKVLADWYQKFGVDLHLDGGGYYGFFKTPAGPFYFAIHPKRADAPKESSSSISVVFRVNDYDGYVSMLKNQGLNAKSVESDSTGHFAHYVDPDGNKMTIWGD